MLCDDICERACRPLGRLNLPPDLAALAEAQQQLVVGLAAKVRDAQCFVLTRTALACIEVVRSARPSTLLSAKEFMRPPFRRVWFEFCRADLLSTVGEVIPLGPGSNRYARMGMLIETTDQTERRGVAYSAFSVDRSEHPEAQRLGIKPPLITVLEAALLFDFMDGQTTQTARRQLNLVPAMRDLHEEVEHLRRLAKGSINVEQEARALKVLNDMVCGVEIERCDSAFHDHALFRPALNELLQRHHEELAIDASLVPAFLVMINSRNAIASSAPDLRRLNRSRERSGKLPMLEHKILDVPISRVQRNGLAALGISSGDIRQHWVRGHFKVRRTGVYWWAAHRRGDADQGIIRNTYRM
jgi:hypothetical protein